MTAQHKPARVDGLRHFAKCACGERFKGSDYGDKLSQHLNETEHTGELSWSYSNAGRIVEYTPMRRDGTLVHPNDIVNSFNEEMAQNTLDDCLSRLGPDSDATGFKAESSESTPRGRLRLICTELNKSAEEVMVTKNEDYAKAEDPFANFRMFGGLGILVRLSDKLARLRQFEERGEFSVSDESLRDTVLDGINYLKLYYAFRVMEGGK